jgi:hypothetical protein
MNRKSIVASIIGLIFTLSVFNAEKAIATSFISEGTLVRYSNHAYSSMFSFGLTERISDLLYSQYEAGFYSNNGYGGGYISANLGLDTTFDFLKIRTNIGPLIAPSIDSSVKSHININWDVFLGITNGTNSIGVNYKRIFSPTLSSDVGFIGLQTIISI